MPPRRDQGDADAQFNLGVMHMNGAGVAQDFAEAVRCDRLAADQGLALAQHNLGRMHDNGDGVQQNFGEAARLHRLAADQGLADAQFNLGATCANGDGVPQNHTDAARWCRLAADQGDAAAQRNLETMQKNAAGLRGTAPRQHGGTASRCTTASVAPAGGATCVPQKGSSHDVARPLKKHSERFRFLILRPGVSWKHPPQSAPRK